MAAKPNKKKLYVELKSWKEASERNQGRVGVHVDVGLGTPQSHFVPGQHTSCVESMIVLLSIHPVKLVDKIDLARSIDKIPPSLSPLESSQF